MKRIVACTAMMLLANLVYNPVSAVPELRTKTESCTCNPCTCNPCKCGAKSKSSKSGRTCKSSSRTCTKKGN